jgi:hypothetical protein
LFACVGTNIFYERSISQPFERSKKTLKKLRYVVVISLEVCFYTNIEIFFGFKYFVVDLGCKQYGKYLINVLAAGIE